MVFTYTYNSQVFCGVPEILPDNVRAPVRGRSVSGRGSRHGRGRPRGSRTRGRGVGHAEQIEDRVSQQSAGSGVGIGGDTDLGQSQIQGANRQGYV